MDEIIWTEDERNARPFIRHHGTLGPTTALWGNRPGWPLRPGVVIYPGATTAPGGYTPYAAPPVFNQAQAPAYNPVHPAASTMPGYPLTPGGKLAQFATPKLIEGAAKLLASFLPVPPAPAATGAVEDDVANGITYHAALAAHAKRDEQIRTIGWLAAQLLG